MPLTNNKCLAYALLICFMLVSTIYLVKDSGKFTTQPIQSSDDEKLSDFYQTWCDVRKYRKDWKRIQEPCKGLTKWGSSKEGWNKPTDAAKSVIISMEMRPTYEFSRILIQSRTKNNIVKTIGGDSWRVHLRGPSSPFTTVIDRQNGTYEAVFLLTEPGTYRISAYLEHSLCDGLKDPPDNWFIIGNAQGKYQPHGSLGNDHAYIAEKLKATTKATIDVQEQKSTEYLQAVKVLMRTGHSICKDTCNFIWDGHGRWIDDKWHPYQDTAANLKGSEVTAPIKQNHDGLLWLYGDSVMAQFYSNVKLFGRLCHMFTGRCGHSYNWVYNIKGYNTTRAKLENDEKDFNVSRILDEVNQIMYYPSVNKPGSILFMNFGLHFAESTTFSNYKVLITELLKLLKRKEFYEGKIIWRTTTSLNQHKLGGKHQHSRRFLTHQRVTLLNAYATSQMCASGVSVLDLFPMTDSYPRGSGIGGYQFDAVHYEHKVFATAEKRLEEVLKNI